MLFLVLLYGTFMFSHVWILEKKKCYEPCPQQWPGKPNICWLVMHQRGRAMEWPLSGHMYLGIECPPAWDCGELECLNNMRAVLFEDSYGFGKWLRQMASALLKELLNFNRGFCINQLFEVYLNYILVSLTITRNIRGKHPLFSNRVTINERIKVKKKLTMNCCSLYLFLNSCIW